MTPAPSIERELRLRQRIDDLMDRVDELTVERDAALGALWEARGERRRWYQAAYVARKSRDFWRRRAGAAEWGIKR